MTDGRDVLAHVALALSRYAREARSDGIAVPPEVDSLAQLLIDAAKPRQGATDRVSAVDCGETGRMDRALLTKREAAGALRCSTRTLERIIASGALPAVRIEGQVRIRRVDLDAFVAALLPSSFRGQVETKDGAA